MYSYGDRVSVADRWRDHRLHPALQLSQGRGDSASAVVSDRLHFWIGIQPWLSRFTDAARFHRRPLGKTVAAVYTRGSATLGMMALFLSLALV